MILGYNDHGYYEISLRVIHKWRHGLRGGGGQGFCDDSTKALVIQSVTMGGGDVKIV